MSQIQIGYLVIILLLAIVMVLIYLYIKKHNLYKAISVKYKDIIDLDKVIKEKESSVSNLDEKLDNLNKEYNERFQELNNDYLQKKKTFEKLLHEISILEEDLELQSYGLYKPHYDFETSERYKEELEAIRTKQKELIREKTAFVCHTEWTVSGSKRKGQQMTNQYMRLMLRDFNGECDAAILKVRWNNILTMEKRVRKAYEAINKLGTVHNIEITSEYFHFKLEELRLTHEYQEKRHEEKEEQRRIREQIREDDRAQKEIEKARKEAEVEERRCQQALEKAKKEVERAQGEKLIGLNEKIVKLEEQLREAQQLKERAISRAQLTKSGYIYVISNIGSFGKNVYKIGMTRRLEPTDRVRELSGASVPFPYDVHAMIYSENAPELENKLHNLFKSQRINMVNTRKEFFRATLDEIQRIVEENHGGIDFAKIPEAKEYRETVAMLQSDEKEEPETSIEDKFPESLV